MGCTNLTKHIKQSILQKLTIQSFRAGSISHYGRLNIYGSPINSPERSFPRVIKAVEGKPFVVHCPVAGFPIQDVDWFKGNILEVAFYPFERYCVVVYVYLSTMLLEGYISK